MILKELLERSEYTLVQGSEDVEISTLVYDSRKIEKGSVFVCISGAAFDGHKFVAQAAELGAAAVVVEKDVEVPENLTVIKFDNTRLALAEMSAAYCTPKVCAASYNTFNPYLCAILSISSTLHTFP